MCRAALGLKNLHAQITMISQKKGGYHGDLRVQIFFDQARRGHTHFLRGATLHPPLTVLLRMVVCRTVWGDNNVLRDLSHNCARDPEKNRANASVGRKIWREPRISSLFVWRNKRWRPCRLHFSGCSCAGIPIFQLRIASMSGQS